jgi:hypothetical protein
MTVAFAFRPSRRALLRGIAATSAASLAGCAVLPRPARTPRLRLLAETMLPHRLQFRGTTVGGLSALDHDPSSGTWVALSDDRSVHAPARFYQLRVDLGPGWLTVQPQEVVTLLQANGRPFPPPKEPGEAVDPEGMRLLPGAQGVLWTSEGDRAERTGPTLRQARMDGAHVRDFAVPASLQFGGAEGTGPRNNLTFEGLALTPDGRGAWAAMEGALLQDGPESSVADPGAPCRFTLFELASGRALRQLAYLRDRIPHAPLVPGGLAENGVSEVLMADAQRMLVLERAYMAGRGTSLRIYEIDTQAGSDTLAMPRLLPGEYRPVAKTLVADLGTLGLTRLDNTEGMCWGPRLAGGGRSLVVVSDDNFNPLQVTQFAAFAYQE